MSTHDDIEKTAGVHATSPHHALGQNNGVLPASYNQAVRPSRIGNPGPLGLFSFASTTFMLSLYNLQTRSIHHPNVVVGMAIFCGGLAQLLAGMWEFPRGNVFGGTAFTSYGAFWMSYATILIPGSGILDTFKDDPTELASGLGIYLMAWFMVTFFLLIAALRKNWGFIVLFVFLAVTFLLLAAGEFTAKLAITKAGGVLGVLTAFIAYYVGLSELLASEDMAVVRLPLGVFSKRVD
ncbi:Gpr1 family protein [Crassisporium funariophilum]|nr:Gpr1 family protein [Crassisporium funariophilum]